MKNIIIVESPSKSKTIESYMGKEFHVLSSKGHIRDLATSGPDGLGIDIANGFVPIYKIIKDKTKLVKELESECKGAKVFLATDPDREGEAISFHLASVLGLDLNETNRVEFNEVTKPAIQEAFRNPRKIDMDLVSSQETRRMLDRIIGFKLSKLLQIKIKSAAAGRVQSTALKLICDLEESILAFKPVPYSEIDIMMGNSKMMLESYLGTKNPVLSHSDAESIVSKLNEEFICSNITSKNISRESKPVYTTSTLQQDASTRLSFNSSKTMRIAQSLYEGKSLGNQHVGIITYMRTDSTHISNVFVSEANKYILENYGPNYLGKTKEKEQNFAQNAHEGIRPTSVNRTPESIKGYLTPDEYKLYKLIYARTLASLISPAKFLNTKVSFQNTDTVWSITGQQLLFDGFLKVYGKNDDDNSSSIINEYLVDSKYVGTSPVIKDLETKPHSRYTEASLIKDMEEKGIGRPSTYAQTISNLTNRKYVVIKEKKLYPTDQGVLTSEKLQEFFSPIINVEYTAYMEEILDKISKGDGNSTEELQKFYDQFIPLFTQAKEQMKPVGPKKTGEKCPICGGDLVVRTGKYGEFVACGNYPKCTYIQDNENKENSVDTNIVCPNCGKGHMIKRLAKRGKNAGNYFYTCSNAKCKTILNNEPTTEKCPICGSVMVKTEDGLVCSNNFCKSNTTAEQILCPKCGKGYLVKRVAKKGKNAGNTFYACSNFPRCKNIYTLEPTNEKCPKCGSMMLKDENGTLICSNENCK